MRRAALAAWLLALGACGEAPPAARPRPRFDGAWLEEAGALFLSWQGDAIAGEFVSTSGARRALRGEVRDGALAFGGDRLVLDGRLLRGAFDGRTWRAVRIEGPAVRGLIDVLRGDDARLRRAAAEVLSALGPEARAAVPALLEALRDSALEAAADLALARIGAPEPEALPELICGLRSPAAVVRAAAAAALGRLGAAAAAALSHLEVALEDDAPEVRHAAERAARRVRTQDGRGGP